MTDKKITDLAALTGAGTASGDEIVIVDVSDTSMAATGTDKNQTIAEHAIALATVNGLVAIDKIFDAKGDIVVGTADNTSARLAVGSNTQVLTADSTVSPTGLKWATPATGTGGVLYQFNNSI